MLHKAKRMESLVFLAPKIQNEMYQALFYFNNLGKFEFGITQYFLFICLNLELAIQLFPFSILQYDICIFDVSSIFLDAEVQDNFFVFF